MLTARVEGIGVLGPGLPDWPGTREVLRARQSLHAERTVLPAPQALPPAERRRAGRVVRLALAVGAEALAAAGIGAQDLPTVFSSSGGDGDNCHELCAALASTESFISPTRFHNSVHNAPAGYWGIAYGCTAASTSLCAYDASFAAGLIESCAQLAAGAARVLLIAYDADYPPPLRQKRPIGDAFGVALLLGRADRTVSAGAVPAAPVLTLRPGAPAGSAATFEQADLEALRRSIPAARSLPLLAQLARGRSGDVALDYLDTPFEVGVRILATTPEPMP